MKDCIFCKIVSGKSPCHKVWEDDEYLAFLSIFPNTAGTTVVVPKKHFSSYAFDLPDRELSGLILSAKKVSKILDNFFEDVGRTALVFEGFGVDHVHAKLFPMHFTAKDKWEPIKSSDNLKKYFEKYEGYISSHDCEMADEKELSKLARRIADSVNKKS